MIPTMKKWHYFVVIKLSALLTGIKSKHHDDFYCLNCLHSCTTKSKLESHKKLCNNEDFYDAVMSDEENKTEFVLYQKPIRTPITVYADPESLIKKY